MNKYHCDTCGRFLNKVRATWVFRRDYRFCDKHPVDKGLGEVFNSEEWSYTISLGKNRKGVKEKINV